MAIARALRQPAARVALAYLAISWLWILASDTLVNLALGQDLGALAQTYKGLAFVAVTSLALYLLARRHFSTAQPHPDRVAIPRPWLPPAVFALMALGLIATGLFVFHMQRQHILETAEEQLRAVGTLREEQIEEWLADARANAHYFGQRSLLVEEFEAWVAAGGQDPVRLARIQRRLASIRDDYGYRDVSLFDRQGQYRISLQPNEHLAEHRPEALGVIARDEPLLVDFHLHGPNHEPAVGMMAPLAVGSGAGQRSVGALFFSLPARQGLFGRLSRWPGPSPSGETVLMRREGDGLRALFASRAPSRQGLGALFPRPDPRMSAFRVNQGERGVLRDAVDYAGKPVLAYGSPVKGTPWILVTKLDRAEVERPMNRLARATALVVALLLAASGLATWLWWRAQSSSQQAQLLGKELERQVLAKRYDTLSRYASDVILLTDDSGLILEANERVQGLYGYTREELIGQHSTLLLPPGTQEDFHRRRTETLAAGQLLFEAEHQRKDGSRFPVEVNAHVIELHGLRHGHLTIRDISERQAAAEQLRMQAMVLDQIQDQITLTDLAGRITYVNDALCRNTGFARDQILGQDVSVFGNDPGADASQAQIARATLGDGHWQGRIIMVTADGGKIFIDLRTTLIRDAHDQPVCMVGVGNDITQRLRAEQELSEREARYRAVIETSPDGFWMLDREGRLLEVNDAYCQRSGYRREELLGKAISDLDAREDAAEAARHALQVMETGSALFEALHRAKDGSVWLVEVNTTYSPIQGGRFFVFLRDVHRRNRADALLRTRLQLSDRALKDSLDSLMKAALDAAERFTGSRIGFFHFVDPDQETIALQAWSSNTVDKMCTIEAQRQAKGQHYPVSKAGVWADAIRQRQPIMHNDYELLAGRQGLPPGHAPVLRELVVPILRADRVVAVLGVGNKASPYDQDDVAVTEQLASMVMDVVDRKRAEEDLARSNARLLEAQRIAKLGNWEFDVVNGEVTWSPQVYVITGLDPNRTPPDFEAHGKLLHPDDFPIFERDVARALNDGTPYVHELRVVRPNGEIRHMWATGQVAKNADGRVTRLYGTIQDVTERKQAEARLDLAMHFDALTGLPNSRWLLPHLAENMAGPESGRHALLVLNVDRFAQLNESLGRDAGDRALVALARRWSALLPDGSILVRLDADQFAVLWQGGPTAPEAGLANSNLEVFELAEALLASMAEPVPLGEQAPAVALTLSVGVALYPDDAGDATTLLHAAEDAMRNAKAEKGNQFRFYDRRHAQAAVEWFETEGALRLALAEGGLYLDYQPQVDAFNGQVVAAEALIRWRRNGESIPPGRFIHVVEATDLAEPVSRWVLHTACRQARQWLERQHPLRVAVNIFSDHVTSGHLLEDVGQALAESGLPARLLELEVVESSLLANPEVATQTLRQLKELGVGLALDDFGTGYSSLGYLKNYPFDVLKIDQLFARNVNRDAEDAAIVRSTISLGHNLGMRVLAEGIETTPQLRFMARYGCDALQGYLMSRPIPADELETLLAKRPDLRPDGATDGEHTRGILVVEDEPLEAELLAMDLESEGYRVHLCEDMEGALRILGRERIDLVLSDHYLRGETTGVQLLRKLLRLFPDIPRVMMSGTEDKSVVVDAVNQAGIRAFLPKPIDPESLRDTLAAILREGEVSAPGSALLKKA